MVVIFVVIAVVVIVVVLLDPRTYLSSLVKIGSVTAEIMLTLSLCGGWVGGGGSRWMFRVIIISNPTNVMLG